jgi:eukaryotic-like serine/threonine-protein kinase
MASPIPTINSRYQLTGKPIGQGGMGVVYKAYDVVTKRHVALKTMRGPLHPAALELFSKEWTLLAGISHPNIVDILDTGEMDDGGERKPFFVMPFLQGATLDELIVKFSHRLTIERVIGIASQACRGLQAAHERGLIHRDLKPSNIFVMEDDTVKIIDFGVVHLIGADSVTGLKGTVQYMAPEQIEMKPISPASDVFALSVVCYEALTGRKPFARRTDAETAEAIRRHIPPAVSELNPLVTQIVSRVIHKGMAKEPWHRFSTAHEFADTLQKALNNQPIDRFDRNKIQPRIDRAKRAQAEGDLQFASEILTELEAEGNIDPEMTVLRIQIDHAIRQKSARQLLEIAKTRLEEDEFPLALQKIQEVLDLDPDNADALGLQATIERQRSERQIENWFRLVEQHVHNHAFPQARQALKEILKISPAHAKARELLADVDRREEEIRRLWAEKEQLYQAALSSYQHGEISSALTKLERVLELNRQSPDSALPERDAQYQNLYNQIRTEKEAARNSYAEGRRHMADRNFAKALEICSEYLRKFPGDPMFQALQLEIEEQQRQERSSFIADVSRRAEAEPDLDRRVSILKEAVDRYPDEPHFQQSLRLIRERRDLVNSIVVKARQYEERAQCSEALGQWDILRNIYPQYPGIEFEVDRLRRRRNEQAREEAKARWVEQIDRYIAAADYARARALVAAALAEFPEDKELVGLDRLARQALERSAEAEVWLQRGQQLCFDRQFGEGLDALRTAASLDSRNPVIRAALLNALVEQARSLLGQDWRAAEPLIQQALGLDAGHPLAKSLQSLVLDYKHQEIIKECISRARELQAAGDLKGALATLADVLREHPNEIRLVQLRATLRSQLNEQSSVPSPVAASAVNTIPIEKSPENPAVQAQAGTETTALESLVGDSVVTIRKPGLPDDSPAVSPNVVTEKTEPWPKAVQRRFHRALAELRLTGTGRGYFSPLQWLMFALVPVVLLSAYAVGYWRHRQTPPPPAIREYAVGITSIPAANITRMIDGKDAGPFPAALRAGRYQAAAVLPGYKPGPYVVEVKDGVTPQTIQLQLEPEALRIRLAWDLKGGQVRLDDRPEREIQEDEFTADLTPGVKHTLRLLAGGKEAFAADFRVDAGELPTVTPLSAAPDLEAVVIASLAGRARVYTSNSALKNVLRDGTLQPIPPQGLDLDNVTGAPALVLRDNRSVRPPLTLETGNAPLLKILATSDLTTATLLVQCSPPDAVVTVNNGRPLLLGKNGEGQIRRPPGQYTLRATRDGYSPETQVVNLKKADSQTTRLALKPIIRPTSLMVDGAPPGATIVLDGKPFGATDHTGHYENEGGIPEGAHSLTLRKESYEDKVLGSRTFTAGQPVRIEGAMTPYGFLDFTVPANTTVKWRSADGTVSGEGDGRTPLHIKSGHYTVTAENPSYVGGFQEDVIVPPGGRVRFTWQPSRPPIEEKKGGSDAKPPSTEIFERPQEWKQSGQLRIRTGSGIGWVAKNDGAFLISTPKPKSGIARIGDKHLIWVIDYKDEKNQMEYSLHPNGDVERRVIINGKVTDKGKLSLGSRETYSLRIDIRKDRVAVGTGDKMDACQRPNPAAPLGKFGFKGDAAVQLAMER